jgi:hypothetical protein
VVVALARRGDDESFNIIPLFFHALSLVLNHSLSTSPTQLTTTIMADLLTSYNALSPSSPRADLSKVLNAIMSGVWLHEFLSCPITPALTSALKRTSWTMQLVRLSSLPFYQTSGHASPAAQLAGFITQVASTPTRRLERCDR